jgi:hypothetical protein
MWPALLIGVFNTPSASASEWRYCLASWHAQRTVYMSPFLSTDKSMETLQVEFGHNLDRAGYQFDSIQCPRGDQQTISVLRLRAMRYNRETGNTVIEPHWIP